MDREFDRGYYRQPYRGLVSDFPTSRCIRWIRFGSSGARCFIGDVWMVRRGC